MQPLHSPHTSPQTKPMEHNNSDRVTRTPSLSLGANNPITGHADP